MLFSFRRYFCTGFVVIKKRGFYHDAGRIKVSPFMLSRVIIYRNDGGGSTFCGWLLPFFIYDNTLFFAKFQVPLTHSNPFLIKISYCSRSTYGSETLVNARIATKKYFSKDLPREFQLFLCREVFIKRFHLRIVHIVTRRRLVNTGDAAQVPRDQLFA